MAEGITVGNAAKTAVELVDVALKHNTDIENITPLYTQAVDAVLNIMEERTGGPAATIPAPQQAPAQPGPFDAAQSIQSNFPGSTIVAPPGAPQPQQQAPQQTNVVPFPQAQSAPIPGAQQGGGADPQIEQIWRQFFADVQNGQFEANWHDNRGNKRSPSNPDFKHKTWKVNPGDKYNASLWITGNKNPDWVAGALQQIGLG